MTTQALGNHVLIRPDDPTEITAGGIHLTDKSQEKEKVDQGEVVSVGPGVLNSEGRHIQSMTCKRGERVMFRHRRSDRIEVDGDTLHRVPADLVLCVLEPVA